MKDLGRTHGGYMKPSPFPRRTRVPIEVRQAVEAALKSYSTDLRASAGPDGKVTLERTFDSYMPEAATKYDSELPDSTRPPNSLFVELERTVYSSGEGEYTIVLPIFSEYHGKVGTIVSAMELVRQLFNDHKPLVSIDVAWTCYHDPNGMPYIAFTSDKKAVTGLAVLYFSGQDGMRASPDGVRCAMDTYPELFADA